MFRHLKRIGAALCAVLAVGAVAANAASAQDVFTTANGNPAYLHGEQVGTAEENVFGIGHNNPLFSCEGATYSSTGTVANGAGEVLLHPEVSGCTTPFGEATFDTTGCDVVLTGHTESHEKTEAGEGTETDATVSLACEGTNTIKITSAGCTMTMAPAQNQNLLGVVYTNEGSGSTADVKVDVKVDRIHFTSNFICQLGGLPATTTEGYLTQTVTMKGYQGEDKPNPANQVGILAS